ncbi:hypothetical protein B1757_05505 [Acidithiobacillus marinus]|uniref:Methyltransferase domain-containing protein n=1 Tax=Acidithiobacillus marinus TaxID=187490 RepID=A0A2I1DMY6_9PROT|nr:class I SAM-dependent methyltransferase [Acidithiobacillus marinus]PKY11246.1 hypothetical protein B1757_05505 [Acidithiobacillus marinus]
MSKSQPYPKFSYDAHARTCAPDDFLGQVCRTVCGKPVSEDQIRMIREAIHNGLQLRPDDVLLDLACGNGSLSRELFRVCRSYLGVDISEYMISMAKWSFERQPTHVFAVQHGVEYVHQEGHPERFTRALCYAGFQYFSDPDAIDLLATLHKRFSHLERMFIGNLPDKECVTNFYIDRTPSEDELTDPSTAIGIWRTREAFAQLAEASGWQVAFTVMPPSFYAAHYRYDVVLTRKC